MTKPEELRQYRHEIATCSFCPKMCRFSCPVDRVEGSESTSPWGKVTMLRHLQTGLVPLEEGVLQTAYKCTGCMSCKTACLHGQELPPMFEAVRAIGADRQLAPQALYERDGRMAHHGNPVGPALGEELRRRVPAARFDRRAPLLVFFGCTTLKRFPGIVDETLRVLEAAQVDFAVAGPEQSCSGLPSLSHGFPRRFEEAARRNVERFRHFERIVSDCPGAVSTFVKRYESFGLPRNIRFDHLSVLLLELLREGRLAPRRPDARNVFYHDPCHLGRHLGVYDEPRELLTRLFGRPPSELGFNRDLSVCSGGGGGLPLTSPGSASEIAALTSAEVRDRDGDLLVSPCPTARKMFRRADETLEVTDPVSLLARGI